MNSYLPGRKVADMIELYRKEEGKLRYWQGWVGPTGRLTVNQGIVGFEGDVSEMDARDPHAKLWSLADAQRSDGFAAMPAEQRTMVMARFPRGLWTSQDEYWLAIEKGEHFLNEALGWLGIGKCDGHDMDAAELTFFSFVVSVPLGPAAVQRTLEGAFGTRDFVVAVRDGEHATVWWPEVQRGKPFPT